LDAPTRKSQSERAAPGRTGLRSEGASGPVAALTFDKNDFQRHFSPAPARRLVVAQRILGRSDPRLIANVYSRVDLGDLRSGLDRINIPAMPMLVGPSAAPPACPPGLPRETNWEKRRAVTH